MTDAGSTKQNVIAAARAHLGAALPRFVPGHPIAGTEHTGAAAAFATLYRDRNVVLTPLAGNDPAAVAMVAALWTACGARVRELDPAGARPHLRRGFAPAALLAFALVDLLAARPDAADVFRYAASGFRDFTRIAAGSPEMWRDIALANRDALVREIDAYRAELDRIAAMVAAGDGAALEAVFSRAAAARRAWGANAFRSRRSGGRLARGVARACDDERGNHGGEASSISRRWLAPRVSSRSRARRAFPIARCCWQRLRRRHDALAVCSTPTTSSGCWKRCRRSGSRSMRIARIARLRVRGLGGVIPVKAARLFSATPAPRFGR